MSYFMSYWYLLLASIKTFSGMRISVWVFFHCENFFWVVKFRGSRVDFTWGEFSRIPERFFFLLILTFSLSTQFSAGQELPGRFLCVGERFQGRNFPCGNFPWELFSIAGGIPGISPGTTSCNLIN